MSKHTAEPWKRSTRSWGGKPYWVVEDQTGAIVCQAEVGFHEYESGSFITVEEEIAANVALIAAAPNLLKACKKALMQERTRNVSGSLVDLLCAAIAEVEGDTT